MRILDYGGLLGWFELQPGLFWVGLDVDDAVANQSYGAHGVSEKDLTEVYPNLKEVSL